MYTVCVYHNEKKYIYIYNSISPIQLQRYVDQAVPVPGVTSDGLLNNKNNIKQMKMAQSIHRDSGRRSAMPH